MRKQMSNSGLFLCFTALTGAVIAGLVWLYLKIANVGITVIWEMIPAYIDSWYYTILMCLAGGVVIGLFHRIYGPYPEQMADSVKRVKDTGTYPYRKLPMIVAASFLSLFFGGAVGPESGLVSLLPSHLLRPALSASIQFFLCRIQSDPVAKIVLPPSPETVLFS